MIYKFKSKGAGDVIMLGNEPVTFVIRATE